MSNFKSISDLPVMESTENLEGVNLVAIDANGASKQIPISAIKIETDEEETPELNEPVIYYTAYSRYDIYTDPDFSNLIKADEFKANYMKGLVKLSYRKDGEEAFLCNAIAYEPYSGRGRAYFYCDGTVRQFELFN